VSIKKTEFKLELILVICFLLFFVKAIGVVREKKDPVSEVQTKQMQQVRGKTVDEQTGLLVVEYATGSDVLKNKEVGGIWIEAPTTVPTPTPVPTDFPAPQTSIQVADLVGTKYRMEDLLKLDYLKDNLYIVNASTKMTEAEFDMEYFISKDLSIEKSETGEQPQILIFHTHASEGFADSRAGEVSDTVVGAGNLLTEILTEKYGYRVMHDTTVFDRKNGKDNRNYAYNDALEQLQKVLEQYPSIEVVIDLHRDAGTKRVATVNGKQTAKVMLFNGLCRNTQGKLSYLPNENLKDNLAFSFQMKLIGDEMYPGLMNRIFLKDYRYNMHLKERFLLVELGTEKNTVEEAMNAMEPLADVLHQVLGG